MYFSFSINWALTEYKAASDNSLSCLLAALWPWRVHCTPVCKGLGTCPHSVGFVKINYDESLWQSWSAVPCARLLPGLADVIPPPGGIIPSSTWSGSEPSWPSFPSGCPHPLGEIVCCRNTVIYSPLLSAPLHSSLRTGAKLFRRLTLAQEWVLVYLLVYIPVHPYKLKHGCWLLPWYAQ